MQTRLFDTAIGKALKVLFFVFVSTGLTAVLAFLKDHQDALGVVYTGIVVAVINAVLVFIQKYRDPNVPNTPQ